LVVGIIKFIEDVYSKYTKNMGLCGPYVTTYLIVISPPLCRTLNTDIWREQLSKGFLTMAASFLLRFIFPPPPSLFITGMSVISLASLAVTGFSEVKGKHLQYSKFWNANPPNNGRKQIKVSSRTGMLILYTPAFLAGLASFVLFQHQDVRFLLVDAALTLHFFKRVFEVKLHMNSNLLQI
jgi:hypothetical protein